VIPASAFATALLRPTVLGRLHPVVRFAGLVLGMASSMVAGGVFSGFLALLLVWWLDRTGLKPRHQLSVLRPWLWAAVLILLVHTFTSTWAAPLWHPSWGGFLAGGKALLRVACSIGWLGLYLRTSSLDDLVQGVRWWLRPLASVGLPVENLGLVLAVALGTAPGVLSEGRRIETVVRLRRTGPGSGGDTGLRGNLFRRSVTAVVDRARVVIPLMETLVRRAEALSLSLRTRRPIAPRSDADPPAAQLMFLAVWLFGIVWYGLGLPGTG
jgi:energy-coupling factor transporter transmembrane protein EcfT